MKKISLFGKRNHVLTQVIITVLSILLGFVSANIGTILYSFDVVMPSYLMMLSVFVFLTAAFFYPIKNSRYRLFSHNYLRQKKHDFVLVLTGVLMWTCVGNYLPSYYQHESLTTIKQTSPYIHYASARQPQTGTPHKTFINNILAKKLFAPFKNFNQKEVQFFSDKTKGITDTGKVIWIILIITLALGLIFLLAALSCGIACSGNNAAGAIVLVLGLIAIVAGTILGIRAIVRRSV